MLQGEHSAILSTFMKLPFVIKTFVWSIFEWPLKTGFTVHEVVDQMYPNHKFSYSYPKNIVRSHHEKTTLFQLMASFSVKL